MPVLLEELKRWVPRKDPVHVVELHDDPLAARRNVEWWRSLAGPPRAVRELALWA